MADSWLQLVEKFRVVYLNEVIIVGLFGVFFDTVVEILAEVLWPCFLQSSKPKLNIFDSLVDDILQRLLCANQVVN